MIGNGILDQFKLPEGVAEAISSKGLKIVPLDDGVSRISGHDKGVGFRFYVYQNYNAVKSRKAGYRKFDSVEMIEWLVDRKNKPQEQVRFLPEELLSFDVDGDCIGGRYKEEYVRFKEGKSAPGFPINRWNVLPDSDVESLASIGVYTVEQYAAKDRKTIESRYPSNFVEAYDQAVQYVNGKERMDMLGAQDEKIEDMAKENAESKQAIADLQAQLQALTAQAKPKAKAKSKAKAK